jgi:hypothetical protein
VTRRYRIGATVGSMVGHMADDVLKFRAGDLKERVHELAAERDVSVSQFLREAVEAYTPPCDSCGECSVCGEHRLDLEQLDESAATATIMGYGAWSETTNADVQALIDRAKELLAEGAVGVSVATDLDPADLPTNPDDVTEEHLMSAHQRIRHVAIVDTPAFSGAYLTEGSDGTLSGPLVFEGAITGDVRAIGPVGTFNLEAIDGRIPIIFDLQDGDHTGTVVGYIDRNERVDGIFGATEAPIAASVGAYPAYLFKQPEPGPMTVSAPDAQGYRRYSGIIAPTGVCHKGRGGCYTYKGASLDYFHSGASIPLDDGTMIRVGPIMFGDLHPDGSVMDYRQALERTNEDARTVGAMGCVYAHPKGALFSGVLMNDVDPMRVQACAPSVELWPDNRGKLELKTALLVPRPAFPVAASIGAGVQLAEAEPAIVDEPQGERGERLDELEKRFDLMEKTVGELFAAHLTHSFDQ